MGADNADDVAVPSDNSGSFRILRTDSPLWRDSMTASWSHLRRLPTGRQRSRGIRTANNTVSRTTRSCFLECSSNTVPNFKGSNTNTNWRAAPVIPLMPTCLAGVVQPGSLPACRCSTPNPHSIFVIYFSVSSPTGEESVKHCLADCISLGRGTYVGTGSVLADDE